MTLKVLQVNVGQPALIGYHHGKPVYSSIAKSRINGRVAVSLQGIHGDDQADKRVAKGQRIHGGVLQAVYAYPVEHLASWASELGINAYPGLFGENLTVQGALETDVRIGDVFEWGGVRLKVTKPRRPCYKLPIHLGRPDAARQMIANGRCGWYFRVEKTGYARPGELVLVSSDRSAPTVAEVFAKKMAADPTIPDASE